MPRVGLTPTDQERADTFTRLLDALQEGVFVGVLNPGTSEPGRTVVANPALKRLFGPPRHPGCVGRSVCAGAVHRRGRTRRLPGSADQRG